MTSTSLSLHLDCASDLLRWLDDAPGVTSEDVTAALRWLSPDGRELDQLASVLLLPVIRLRAMELAAARKAGEAESLKALDRESWVLPWPRERVEKLVRDGRSGGHPTMSEMARELLRLAALLAAWKAERSGAKEAK
ncbi:MAG: hypothetical protein V1755_08665 [Chloroflexota bacterium]